MQISLGQITHECITSINTFAKLICKEVGSVSLKANRGLAGGKQGKSQTEEIFVSLLHAESLVARRFWIRGKRSRYTKDSSLCQTEFDVEAT